MSLGHDARRTILGHPAASSVGTPPFAELCDLGGNRPLNTFMLRSAAGEFLAVGSSSYIASAIYHFTISLSWPPPDKYIFASFSIATFVLIVSVALRQFADIQSQPRHKFLWNGFVAVGLAFSLFLSSMFLLKLSDDYSRGAFLFQIVAAGLAVVIERAISFSRLQFATSRGAIEARRVILIGKAPLKFVDRLKRAGIKTVGEFSLPTRHGKVSKPDTGPDKHIRDTIAICRKLRPDDIFVLSSQRDLPTAIGFTYCLSELPAGVHLVPVDALDILSSATISEFGNVRTIQLSHPPLSLFDQIVKRVFDIIVSAFSLLAFSPLFLAVSLAIKLDSPGPIFFRQGRHGYNNETIDVLKFRTMTTMEPGDKFTQAVRNDARVTAVGRMLRQTNIDELPQLLNVLRGEMSIVGPRPHATAHNEMFVDKIAPFSRRHNVKPGITGWAQVNGYRGETDTLEKMQRRVECDLFYIDNWSFLLDLKIIMLTFFSKQVYLNAY
jgi:Undecaprenyl-phosphate glucose phosphotransferase